MSDIKDPVTSYREIATEWREEWGEWCNSWEFWWVLTLGYSLLTVLAIRAGSEPGTIVSGGGAACWLYLTNRFWGDYRGS